MVKILIAGVVGIGFWLYKFFTTGNLYYLFAVFATMLMGHAIGFMISWNRHSRLDKGRK